MNAPNPTKQQQAHRSAGQYRSPQRVRAGQPPAPQLHVIDTSRIVMHAREQTQHNSAQEAQEIEEALSSMRMLAYALLAAAGTGLAMLIAFFIGLHNS